MVSTRLLAFAAGLALLVAVSVGWRRSRTDDPEPRPEQLLSLVGNALLLLALVSFDGAFGLISDPGMAPRLARITQTALHALSLAAYAGAFWYWKRD